MSTTTHIKFLFLLAKPLSNWAIHFDSIDLYIFLWLLPEDIFGYSNNTKEMTYFQHIFLPIYVLFSLKSFWLHADLFIKLVPLQICF